MCQPQLESGKHARLPNSKTKGKVYPWNHSTSCIPKKESKSCSLAKKHSNAFNPERLSQMLRSFKPPSVHWRESIPSKHWCHATHRLPGASPKKSTAARLQLVATPTLQACSPFPKKKKKLTPLRQFCTHGCCEWVHAVWWTWRCNRPRRGPRGPPPTRLFRLNAVEPRRCMRWSESWLHPSYTFWSFCWGDSTS